MNLADILSFMSTNSYFIIFILMIVEGPITTIIASFFASQGTFNVYLIVTLAIIGDLIADLVLFYLGKIHQTKFLDKRAEKHHIGKQKLEKMKKMLLMHPYKAMFLIKITPPIAPIGLILAGLTKMKIHKFLIYTIPISILTKSIYAAVGFFAGVSIFYFLSLFKFAEILLPFGLLSIILILVTIFYLGKKIKNWMIEKAKKKINSS